MEKSFTTSLHLYRAAKNGPRRASAGTVPLCVIRMYGGFADAEFLRGGADCGPVFDDVLSQAFRPVLHVTLQSTTLPASCWFRLCGGNGGYDEKRKFPAPQSGETGTFQVRPLRAGLFFFGAALAQPAGREPGLCLLAGFPPGRVPWAPLERAPAPL